MARPHPNVKQSRASQGPIAGKQKTGASPNDAGGARSPLRGGAGKPFSLQGRSRLLKTRPSSRDALEVSWPFHHVADSSFRTASGVCGRVDLYRVLPDAENPEAGTLPRGNSGRRNAGF